MFGLTELAEIVKTFWSARWLETLRANLGFIESVSHDWQGDMTAMGNTVKITQLPDFDEADLLAASASGTSQAVTLTSQSLVANKRPYVDYTVDDLSRLQSMDFSAQVADSVNYAIMKRANREILNAIVPSTSAPDHQVAYASTPTLAYADFLTAKELLDTQNVAAGDRFCFLGAAQVADMFNIAEFTSRDYNGGESVTGNGTIGKPFMGFTPRATTMVGAAAIFMHRSAVAVAFQQGMNVKLADGAYSGDRAQRVNSDIIMAVKQLDNKRSVRMD
jgi:hypothetical protein